MTVHAFSRQTNTSNVSYMGTNNNALTGKNYIFFASLNDKTTVPVIKTLLANVYMEVANIAKARRTLEKIFEHVQTTETQEDLYHFFLWFCLPLPGEVNPASGFTHDPIHCHEVLATKLALDEATVNNIVTQMAQKQCPISVCKGPPDAVLQDDMTPLRKNIHLAYAPTTS